jgi:RHS repeat-associated protein
MQTNAAGNNEEVCYSYPFGDGLYCPGAADATEHHFTSKEHDTESGLDYFYARYYSSDLARFMTPDWAAAPTAVPYAMFGDPQSLDLYAYVGNNPNTGIDLDGHVGGDAGSDQVTEEMAAEAANAVGETAGMAGQDKMFDYAGGSPFDSRSTGSDVSGNDEEAGWKMGWRPTCWCDAGAHGKGERRHSGNRHGSGDEDKHVKPDPNKPGNILVKDPHTGKWASVPDPKAKPAVPEPERVGKPGKKSLQDQIDSAEKSIASWFNDQWQGVKNELNKMPGGANYHPGPIPLPFYPIPAIP